MRKDLQPQAIRARELYGDFWFNSDPVVVSAHRGQPILIHFWDYTCSASQRTLPYIKEWHARYAEHGLVVVGVHTPKFDFGKNPQEVDQAVRRLGIAYPVVADNESLIASHYDCRSWPCLFLIDKNGFIRFEVMGEGDYAMIEHTIQSLLYESGVREELPTKMEPVREEDAEGARCYRVSSEIFAGYRRGSIGNVEGFLPESVVEYSDPGFYLEGRFYAVGRWMNEKDCMRLSETLQKSGQIILNYEAVEVNAVIKPADGKGFRVFVQQDDVYLNQENTGNDVGIDEEGKSYILVNEARMYNLVRNKTFDNHNLRLSTNDNTFALYSFTFVTGIIPELYSNN